MQPRFGISLLVLTAAMLGLNTARAHAQTTQPVSLPANWQQMSPTDLAAAIRPLFDQDTFKLLSQADQAAVKERGAPDRVRRHLPATSQAAVNY